MAAFDDLDYGEAQDLLRQAGISSIWKEALLYFTGNHWQDGKGWIGPSLPQKHPMYKETVKQIQKAFVSKNAVKEVMERHKNGVVGWEPSWSLTIRRPLGEGDAPTDEEDALIKEAEALLTSFWDERNIGSLLGEGIEPLLYAGKGCFRLFIPPGKLRERVVFETGEESEIEVPEFEDTEEGRDQAMRLLFVEVPPADAAAVVEDPDYKERLSVLVFKEANDTVYEVSYVDDEGLTVLRQFREQVGENGQGEREEDGEAVVLDLDGNLWLYQMSRDPIISEQVLQNQRLLNLALTMIPRNLIQAGFLERIILNAQLPGKKKLNENGVEIWEPEPLHVGAGTTNFLQGVEQIDQATGRMTIANPSVVFRDPVKVETFRESKEEAYLTILEETHQAHILTNSESNLSGTSRVQARADYSADLSLTGLEIEGACRWLLETALAAIAELCGRQGKYDQLRARVEVRINAGPLTPEEKNAIVAEYKEGLISKETAIMRLGTPDAAAEIERIEAEMQESLSRKKEQAEIIKLLIGDVPLRGLAAWLGVEEEDLRELTQTDIVPEGLRQ